MMEENRLRLGVIFGGKSGEHEVSLMSARSILSALDSTKYVIIQIGIAEDGGWWTGEDVIGKFELGKRTNDLLRVSLFPDPTTKGTFLVEANEPENNQQDMMSYPYSFAFQIDVVFPILHGTFGEDGTLQGVFEIADIAYVGAGVLGSALGMDKGVFKDVMRANQIPVLESLTVTRSEIQENLDETLSCAEELARYPLFVKPANLGSSVGITKCLSRSDLMEGLMEAARYDRRVLIERGVNAREIEVSVLGNDQPIVSVPGEIIPGRDFYSYEAKYYDNSSQLLIPAPISSGMTERVQELALKAYRAIDCAGMARVDFLLEKDDSNPCGEGTLYMSEVNTIPGFTKISMYPKLWDASGLPYSKLVDRLIELAIERKQVRDQTVHRYDRGN